MANVIVGCKLPHGLLAEVNGKQFLFRGANSSEIIGGYGTTPVDKEFADAWIEAEKDTPLVKNGLIFVADNARDANAAAKDGEGEKTGLEGLDPDNPVPGVEQAKE